MFQKSKINIPNGRRILVCPLDWGLGHASRMIPIVRLLLSHKKEVIIAADNYPLKLLRSEFPFLPFIVFPSFVISYPRNSSMVWTMMKQLPKIIYGIYKEHKHLQQIIDSHKIDVVISDNRFGLWSKTVETIYITHQIMIKMPRSIRFLETVFYNIHKKIIGKYNHCWIPDFEGENSFSGDLAHKYPAPPNAAYIGVISRFDSIQGRKTDKYLNFKALIILSGPEPQRTILEEIIVFQANKFKQKVLIVRGKPSGEVKPDSTFVSNCNHLPVQEFANAVASIPLVICRSGYSSVMDLYYLNKKAFLVPTPGQTEQEYLAYYYKKTGRFMSVNQDKLELAEVLNPVFDSCFY